jgi:hypothetical protein
MCIECATNKRGGGAGCGVHAAMKTHISFPSDSQKSQGEFQQFASEQNAENAMDEVTTNKLMQ